MEFYPAMNRHGGGAPLAKDVRDLRFFFRFSMPKIVHSPKKKAVAVVVADGLQAMIICAHTLLYRGKRCGATPAVVIR